MVGTGANDGRPLRIVFCGTPQFAVPTLKHLLAQPDFEIVAVISQPDRPSGRGMKLKFSAVKEAALAAGVPVHQPEKIRAAESRATIEQLKPDVIVIIAYGQIIPASLLTIPKYGWINLHGSLLPKYRGAAPIQWAIANGETRTGLTTMRIDAGMDTGRHAAARGDRDRSKRDDSGTCRATGRDGRSLDGEDAAWPGGRFAESAASTARCGHVGAAAEERRRKDRLEFDRRSKFTTACARSHRGRGRSAVFADFRVTLRASRRLKR